MLLLGIFFLPLSAAEAKTINVSSSTFASSSVSSTVAQANDWLQKKFGIDLFHLLNKVISFIILVIKLAINVLLEILPKIQQFLSAY